MAHIEAESGVNPFGKIDTTAFKSPSEVPNEQALQLVVQDTMATESWLQQNYWSLRWREADSLYQSPPGIMMWEGTTQPRSNLNRFTVAETVNAIHPQVLNGLFYETPAFILREQPNLTENTSRAITALLAMQLTEMNIREEVDWALFSALTFGTLIMKWGFKSYTKKKVKYVRQESPVVVNSALPGQPPQHISTPRSMDFIRVEEDVQVHIPTLENKDIRYVLPDSGLRVPDIRKAKFVVDRFYFTYRDLIKLKDEEYVSIDANGKQTLKKRYDLPDEKTIRSWFDPPKEAPAEPGKTEATAVQGTTFVHHAKAVFKKTTEDPLNEPLEVLERWDNDKVITVLNRVKVIRNEPNEFGEIPFLSCNWWNIPDAFWGLGLGRVIGVEQRVQAGLINACLDLANLIVNPMFVRARGANIQEQQIRQRIGGILTVDTSKEQGITAQNALTMLQQPNIPAEIIQQIALSEARVEKTSGASEQLTMGASTGKAGLGRSGTGAAAMIQATMNRIGGFTEMFVRQVYEPLLYKMHELNRDKLPMSYIQQVLGEKLGSEFTFDPSDFLNAPAEFEVLAGSHLAAKSQMAQSLFMMIQLFENAPLMAQLNEVSQKKVNIEELFHMVHDLSGWKNYYDIIQDMTDEEKQRMNQKQNPQAQQLQGKMQLQQQKFSQQQQIIDQDNEAKIARDIFRHLSEASAQPEELQGDAGATSGFGSQETA